MPWAWASSRLSGAGSPAVPGRVMPSTSASSPMVEAVPMVLQCPRLRIIEDSEARKSCLRTACRPGPPRSAATRRYRSRAAGRGTCRSASARRGRTTAGRSTDAAPISRAGMVLSHPPSSTTPSIGLARIISSVAIAAMFRHSIAVGRTQRFAQRHHRQLQRNPARLPHPRLRRCSATSVRCGLHGARSDAVLAMAICGPAGERRVGQAPAHPGPVEVAVLVVAAVPVLLRRSVIVSLLQACRSNMRNAMDVTPAPEPRIR